MLELFSSIALDIQEFFFRRKREKRRRLEEKKGLPKKRMVSPYQRVFALLIIVSLVYIVVKGFIFPAILIDNNNSNKVKKIKNLLEKEKEAFGSYPERLHTIKRGNPLRKDLLIDGWGTTFKYEVRNDSYVLISAGKDKKFDTEDDLQLN